MTNTAKPKLTIFTPAWNRADLLPRLFRSIADQVPADGSVEWLVIDDGSTDDTSEVLARFAAERPDLVRFLRVENGGKHRAINRGLDESRGEMFFIVDSDDYLPVGSVHKVLGWAMQTSGDEVLAGFGGLMSDPIGAVLGDAVFQGAPVISDVIDRRQRLGVQGDVAKIVRTEVLRRFRFPDIDGENFVAESIVWNRISESYRFLYFNDVIYVADYQSDGLSAQSVRNRMRNPIGATMLYSELFRNKRASRMTRIKALINYWRFFFCRVDRLKRGFNETGSLAGSILAIPASYWMHRRDSRVSL